MFIRKNKKTDSVTKKIYYTYQLVESYRSSAGPRQRILLNLGSNLSITDEERKLLANRIEEITKGETSLFKPPKHIECLAQNFAEQLTRKWLSKSGPKNQSSNTSFETIDLDSLEVSDSRTIGVEALGLKTLQKLNLADELNRLGLSQHQIDILLGVIIGRITAPGSERATRYWLRNTSATDELLNTNFSKLSERAIYSISDQLIDIKDDIEAYLEETEKKLFNFQDLIFLYDLTNTYLTGSAKGSQKARRGRSKEKRSKNPLVTLGLRINQEGFIKKSRILEGNVSEPGTLQQVVADLEANCQGPKPILVFDAGMATESNLEWLREKGLAYITVSRQRKHPIIEPDQQQIIRKNSDSEIRAVLVENEKTGEKELHCQSSNRQEREREIQKKFKQYFEEALQKISEGLKKKRTIKKYEKIVERIGRLKEKYSLISSHYDIVIEQDQITDNVIAIQWSYNERSNFRGFQGAYILRAYKVDLDPEMLWKTYIMLTEVESVFRSLKSELGLRPIYHQLEHRMDAHLFISVLAYHVVHIIRMNLKEKGLNYSWESIRQIMSTQVRVTTELTNEKKERVCIRKTTRPNPEQMEIYRALDIQQRPLSTKKTTLGKDVVQKLAPKKTQTPVF